ncbi:Hypothetical predicted protein [Mytilus galloprovincialis]|uniref:Uncharacterized protein n=1 Tax=Mytilus galloprovincialis TaxID=29158 RepID=A0A8B6F3G1_MYTGA|nr:Hypothetical predicted protein [Mytilus galloprovincialis]
MGNDLQYMTSVPNLCRGLSESIQNKIFGLGTNDSCNQDNSDSLNRNTFINNGLNTSTETTDRNNHDTFIPCTLMKTLHKSDRSEKEKVNQENVKRKEKIPRTSTPTSKISKPKSDVNRSSSIQSSVCYGGKKQLNSCTGATTGLIPNKPIDNLREWSPCSDVSNASSCGSYKV